MALQHYGSFDECLSDDGYDYNSNSLHDFHKPESISIQFNPITYERNSYSDDSDVESPPPYHHPKFEPRSMSIKFDAIRYEESLRDDSSRSHSMSTQSYFDPKPISISFNTVSYKEDFLGHNGRSQSTSTHQYRESLSVIHQRPSLSQRSTAHDDGRELDLLYRIYNDPDIEQIWGSPQRVLQAIEEFERLRGHLMSVGEEQGKIVTDLIAEVKPDVMVELGGYIGYTCILFADALRKAGGTHFYTIESDPKFAAVLLSLVNLAGLTSIVSVIVGEPSTSLKRLQKRGELSKIDFLFLDHEKQGCLDNLRLCEELGLVSQGSVIATNGLKEGCSQDDLYAEYVRGDVKTRREVAKREERRWEIEDRDLIVAPLAVNFANQFDKDETAYEQVIPERVEGNQNLIYESRLATAKGANEISHGVEITKCLGEDKSMDMTEFARYVRNFSIESLY